MELARGWRREREEKERRERGEAGLQALLSVAMLFVAILLLPTQLPHYLTSPHYLTHYTLIFFEPFTSTA